MVSASEPGRNPVGYRSLGGAAIEERCGSPSREGTVRNCLSPFRSCEAVIAEACFLMRKVDAAGSAEVVALGRKGVYEISLSVTDHWAYIEKLLQKYANRPISFADACLIRCAEVWQEPRILTFDSDFSIYLWGRNRKFGPAVGNAFFVKSFSDAECLVSSSQEIATPKWRMPETLARFIRRTLEWTRPSKSSSIPNTSAGGDCS